MTRQKLDLLENALDSLGEALTKYQEGETGNNEAYKFATLNLSHFIELIFKILLGWQPIMMNAIRLNTKPC